MIYTEGQKTSIIYQTQQWLGDLAEQLTSLESSMQPCSDLYCQGYTVRSLMLAIQRNDFFIASVPVEDPPVHVGLEEWQIENLYTCLVTITDVKDYPVFTPLTIERPPDVIIGKEGPAGPSGVDGADGINANIEVISSLDYIRIESYPKPSDPLVTIYELIDNLYIEATVTLALDPSTTVIEIGNVLDVTLNINLLKGRDEVISSEIISPSSINPAYQAIVDLDGLNAGGPSGRSIVASGIIATTTFTVNIADITNVNSASVVKTFVYPFLWGSTTVEPIDPYATLTKNISVRGTKGVAFNAIDSYFWFCYPSTYGDLSSIKDQNGFEVKNSFTKITQDVTSTGLTNDWTIGYNLYRTTAKTDITGTFTFTF